MATEQNLPGNKFNLIDNLDRSLFPRVAHMAELVRSKAGERGISPDEIHNFLDFNREKDLFPQSRALTKLGIVGVFSGALGILAKMGLSYDPAFTAAHLNLPIAPGFHNSFQSLWGDIANSSVPQNGWFHIAETVKDASSIPILAGLGGLAGHFSERAKKTLDIGGRSQMVQDYLASIDALIKTGTATEVGKLKAGWELPAGSTLHITFDGDAGAEQLATQNEETRQSSILMQARRPESADAGHPWWAHLDYNVSEDEYAANFRTALEAVHFDQGEGIIHPSKSRDMLFSGNEGLDVGFDTIVHSYEEARANMPDKPVRVVVSKRIHRPHINSDYIGPGIPAEKEQTTKTIIAEIPEEDIIDISEIATTRVIAYASVHGNGRIHFQEDDTEQYTTEFYGYLDALAYTSKEAGQATEVIYEKADRKAMKRVFDPATSVFSLTPQQVLIFQNTSAADIIRAQIKAKLEAEPNCGLSLDQVIVGAEIEKEELQRFAARQ